MNPVDAYVKELDNSVLEAKYRLIYISIVALLFFIVLGVGWLTGTLMDNSVALKLALYTLLVVAITLKYSDYRWTQGMKEALNK